MNAARDRLHDVGGHINLYSMPSPLTTTSCATQGSATASSGLRAYNPRCTEVCRTRTESLIFQAHIQLQGAISQAQGGLHGMKCCTCRKLGHRNKDCPQVRRRQLQEYQDIRVFQIMFSVHHSISFRRCGPTEHERSISRNSRNKQGRRETMWCSVRLNMAPPDYECQL